MIQVYCILLYQIYNNHNNLLTILELDEDDLRDVEKKLKNAKFNKATWKTLGSELGLYRTTLANIEASARGDVESCFTECLTKWLMRVDDVDSHGKPTYNSLIAALKQMEETKNVVDALSECITKTILIL